jgi:hypothetical protein
MKTKKLEIAFRDNKLQDAFMTWLEAVQELAPHLELGEYFVLEAARVRNLNERNATITAKVKDNQLKYDKNMYPAYKPDEVEITIGGVKIEGPFENGEVNK